MIEPGGQREGHGLRHRQARDRREPHRDGLDHGHAELHVAGAGQGPEGGRALRPLLVGLRALRVPDRSEAVPGHERFRDPGEDPDGGAAACRLRGHGPAGRDRRRAEARDGEGPGGALRLGSRADRGAPQRRPHGARLDGDGGARAGAANSAPRSRAVDARRVAGSLARRALGPRRSGSASRPRCCWGSRFSPPARSAASGARRASPARAAGWSSSTRPA